MSRAFAEIGFRDAYREANPDAAAMPGITWTPGYPAPTRRPNETYDRIDWVLVAGDVETLASQLVGESGGQDVEIAVDQWASDHRAVVSTLRIRPLTPPLYVSVESRRIERGEPVAIRYHVAGIEGERVAIAPADGVAGDVLMSLPPQEAYTTGAMMLGSWTLEPGPYDVLLLDAAGGETARNRFWVVALGAAPELAVNNPSVAVGQPVEVSWRNAPGYKWDWLAVYDGGDPDLDNYYGYIYIGAAPGGTTTIDESWFSAPLESGDYTIRLFRDDGYVELASTTFTVTGE